MQQGGQEYSPHGQAPQAQQAYRPPEGQPPQPPWGPSGQGAGYPGGPPRKTNGKAIAALILGIAGCCVFQILAIPALVLGLMAKKEIEQDPSQGGRGMAIAGIVLGIIGIAVLLLVILMLIIFGITFFAFLMDPEGYCEENPDADICEAIESSAPTGALLFAPLLARPGGLAATASGRPRHPAWAV